MRRTIAAELRQYADYDSRSGEPLGARMRAAADLIDAMLGALKDSEEILFHLGGTGKTPSKDEAIDAVRERVLDAIAKAEVVP